MELIVSHSNTDFDGLAAQLAASKLYPRALPVLNQRLRDNVAEFEAQYRDELPFISEDDLPDEQVRRLIVVDMPNAPALHGLEHAAVPTLIFDHHPRSAPERPHEQLIHADVGAATTILVERLISERIVLSATEATLLLLGIYEDTGSLSYSATRQADVAAAAWLLGQGARLDLLQEFLHRPLTPAQQRIFQRLEQSMQVLDLAGVTVLLATAQIAADAPQLSVLAEKLRDLYAPMIVALAFTTGNNGTQIILRSNPELLDAGAVAKRFGGGGHAAAAAAFVRERVATDLLPELETAIRQLLRPLQTAGTVMSRSVRTLANDATIGEATQLVNETNYAAFPVVDKAGQAVGLLRAAEIRAAARYGYLDAPITAYLWHEPPMVAPTTDLATVRQYLAALPGVVLVVDQQTQLLGLISVSDLVHALAPSQQRENPMLGRQLDRFLAPELLALMRQAADIATEQGSALYLVGGTVRDMLLGRAQGDIDLLLEGDAAKLAEALAPQLGGTVRSHQHFGTATIELPDQRTLDVVTARSEFYRVPAALPQVTPASLRNDLFRRDFTVNTLAIALGPDRYGQLYDFYGGRTDLGKRIIRVLHPISFIDDPTRMLRAARLATRLDFTIEPHTRQLIADALEQGVLKRLSPQRIFNELRLVLQEPRPEMVIKLMDELGLLQALHPALRWSHTLSTWLVAARTADGADLEDITLALIVYSLDDAARSELIEHYQPSNAKRVLLQDVSRVKQQRETLAQVKDSVLDRLLDQVQPAALQAARIAEGGQIASAIDHYLRDLRPTRTALNGDDLVRLGVRPGPGFRSVLAELRAAKLDGLLLSRDDEERWVVAEIQR